MPSTYTSNNGIEKIGSGEQAGTWDVTTNTNFDLIDESLDGAVTVTLGAVGTSGSPNALAVTDGASSDGRHRYVTFNDGGDLGGTAYVQLTPNDAEKIMIVKNSLSASRSILLFQGTYNAANDYELRNGDTVMVYFNGGGTGATVTKVELVSDIGPNDNVDINGGAIDGTTIGAASAAAGTFTTFTATGTVTLSGTAVTFSGTTISDLGTVTTADINGGTIDGVTIGGSSAAAGSFTTLSASGGITGTLQTAAQANVTSLGTLTSLSVSGDVDISGSLDVASDIGHIGDPDTVIAFSTDAVNVQTGASSRLDVSNSGVRMGGANARVTTILDEDDMASDSATALATQQSIKAYIDSITLGVNQTWQDLTGSRSAGTTYQNTTGKPIMVSIRDVDSVERYLQISEDNVTFYSVGKAAGHGGAIDADAAQGIVPNNHYYKLNAGSGFSWYELR